MSPEMHEGTQSCSCVRNCPGLPWHRTSLVCTNQTVADRGLGQCPQRQSPYLLWSLISLLKALITVSGCIHHSAAQGLMHQPSSAPARPCTARACTVPARQLSMLLGGRKRLHCRGTDTLCFSCAPKVHSISFFPYIYLFERMTHICIHTS